MDAKAILSVCLWAMSSYFGSCRVQGHGFVTRKVTYTYRLDGTADKLLKVQSIRQADMSQHCTTSKPPIFLLVIFLFFPVPLFLSFFLSFLLFLPYFFLVHFPYFEKLSLRV
jgi:hypothetical protein